MAESAHGELAPHYYRDNFLRLCDTVQEQYADLLQDDELAFLQEFQRLSFTAQCLYIRLISRTGPWFRESKLAYAELGPLHTAVDELLAKGYAQVMACPATNELGALFTRAELSGIFQSLLPKRYPDKPAQLAAIEALALPGEALLSLLESHGEGRIVAPAAADTVILMQLLFFGNRHQGITEFVLSDLGVVNYYPYPLDRQHRQFASRAAIQEYLACAALGEAHHELMEQGLAESLPELAQQALALDIHHDSSTGRWARLCNRLARDLERGEHWEQALQLYKRSTRHPCRERTARILERQENWAAAKQQCEAILAAPWCEEEAEAACRILPRLQRKLGEKAVPRPRDNFPHINLQLPQQDSRVEHLAATALQQQWSQVHYVENSLMNTLFGLAFWQVIFAPVPGAFQHAFQSTPADMYDGSFLAARSVLIEQRFNELRAANLRAELTRAYRQYYPHQCRWVDWRRIDEDLVASAASIIPATHLLGIWQRMLFDPASNRRGFPDLIALGESEGQYCLVEVKGPGDTLQDSQKRWLRFFAGQDIPAQVAWVQWLDD